jgi:excisionase family DNA binding protein
VSEQQPWRITAPEIAKRLGVSMPTVYSWLSAGILPGTRYGETREAWFIHRAEFERWLAAGNTDDRELEDRISRAVERALRNVLGEFEPTIRFHRTSEATPARLAAIRAAR